MTKINLDFLMGGFCNPQKDQVLLHALCNLKKIPFTPNMGAESAYSISSKAQPIYTACKFPKAPTGDYGTCSFNLRELASLLISRGEISETQLDDEIVSLMSSVYSDTGYIDSMGPFF